MAKYAMPTIEQTAASDQSTIFPVLTCPRPPASSARQFAAIGGLRRGVGDLEPRQRQRRDAAQPHHIRRPVGAAHVAERPDIDDGVVLDDLDAAGEPERHAALAVGPAVEIDRAMRGRSGRRFDDLAGNRGGGGGIRLLLSCANPAHICACPDQPAREPSRRLEADHVEAAGTGLRRARRRPRPASRRRRRPRDCCTVADAATRCQMSWIR